MYMVQREMCTGTNRYDLISDNIELEVSRKVRETQGGSPVVIRVTPEPGDDGEDVEYHDGWSEL